jgi:DNA-binding transcriptional regulator YbjK
VRLSPAQRRDVIIGAAAKIIAEHGAPYVSVSAVARHCDVVTSASCVKLYFPGGADALVAAGRKKLAEVMNTAPRRRRASA